MQYAPTSKTLIMHRLVRLLPSVSPSASPLGVHPGIDVDHLGADQPDQFMSRAFLRRLALTSQRHLR